MLYYLGEVLRNDKKKMDGCSDEKFEASTCFTVRTGSGKERAYFNVKSDGAPALGRAGSLSVRFQGKRYWIPADYPEHGLSYLALTLVDHVFGILQEASEPPGVSTLTLSRPVSTR